MIGLGRASNEGCVFYSSARGDFVAALPDLVFAMVELPG